MEFHLVADLGLGLELRIGGHALRLAAEVDEDFVLFGVDGNNSAALGTLGLIARRWRLLLLGLVKTVKRVQGEIAECVVDFLVELVGGSILLFDFVVAGHGFLSLPHKTSSLAWYRQWGKRARGVECRQMASTSLVSLGLPRADLHPRELACAPIPGLYVHVPFCFHKCHYCDFYSITRQTPDRMARFVELVLAEAEMWNGPDAPIVRPRTVFFGGGTPSLLPMDLMRGLIAGLRARFDFSELNEWTVEVNPATASLEYCHMLRESGVDRLSFGAQSFDRDELKVLERHHDPEDVPRSIDFARAAGFSRLNVDLIYAIPNKKVVSPLNKGDTTLYFGQTVDSWARSLDAAVALGVPHVSAYNLTYEPNTPIAVKKRLGQLDLTCESTELEMMRVARDAALRIGPAAV